MKLESALQIMLQRADTLTIIEVVAYTNRLNILLRRNGCTDEERKSGLELFEQLTERMRILDKKGPDTFVDQQVYPAPFCGI